jgi:hypothetical protein
MSVHLVLQRLEEVCLFLFFFVSWMGVRKKKKNW